MSTRILVAGIGNIFLSDDGFGSAVVRELAGDDVPPGVVVTDYGIGGLHLAYDVADGVDTLVLVDTMPLDAEPGTVELFEVDLDDVPDPEDVPQLDAHGMNPVAVLTSVRRLGGTLPRTIVVGCQPACLDEGMGLSAPVATAIAAARDAVRELIETELSMLGTSTQRKE